MKKLLGIICVVVLCASFSAAATGKKKARKPGTKQAATSTHSSKSVQRKTARTTTRNGKAGKKAARTVAKKPRGQQAIDGDRAREIQAALIREKYLDGEPTGAWDQRTKDAMTRFQNDNGWQTKIIPDSRALIKLGLGPKHAGLINPESLGGTMLPEAAREVRPGGGTRQR